MNRLVWVGCLMVLHGGLQVGAEQADWWQAQKDLTHLLLREQADITEIVSEQTACQPGTAQEHLFKLCVMMRAGADREAVAAMKDLRAAVPDLGIHQVSQAYHYACDKLLAWELARSLVEIFAEDLYDISLQNRLIKQMLQSGWTFEQVDQWLADKPAGRDQFWAKERLRFHTSQGKGTAWVKQLCIAAKKHPEDTAGALALLDVLQVADRRHVASRDLSWMTDSVEPSKATEAEKIAGQLQSLMEYEVALHFYRLAMKIPLTQNEIQERSMMNQRAMPALEISRVIPRGFDVHVREQMAKCLLELGKPKEAQEWMMKAADIREEHNLGLNPWLAGQVQGASGLRAMEHRIREKEELAKDDPEYWRERSMYYRGRKEIAQEEHAIRQGLALTAPRPAPEHRYKGYHDLRSAFLHDYARFLKLHHREAEAVALLRKELEEAPANAESARQAARELGFRFPDLLEADDEVLWTWLENQTTWENESERLLWRMLEQAERKHLNPYFLRAERAALQQGPQSCYTLGWIMNRMAFPVRSIPLLTKAMEEAKDKDRKERAAFTLLESYLDAGKWKNAEQIFPTAANRLTAGEVPEWYAKIAVLAARHGAKEDALRIWTRVANIAPYQARGLEELVRAGLTPDLKRLYTDMGKRMPASALPEKILATLD